MADAHDDLIYDWNVEREDWRPSRPVTFDDETLRDGLQNPSVRNPSLDEKQELIRLMDRLGIQTVNVGLPGAGPRHYQDCLALVRTMLEEKLSIRPNVACRTVVSDISPVRDFMDETGIPVLANCFIGSSPIRLFTEDWTFETVLGHVETSLKWAADHEVPFALVTEDTTRSRPDQIRKLYERAIELGAERLVVCDTCGHATPEGTYRLVRFIREIVEESGRDVKIDWHGHRDRGLGEANCIAAVKAGADQIHGAALGIGERAGNAAMDLILVNFKLLGWIDNDLSALAEYCRKASEYLGVPIPNNYPVVGHDAFLTGTGVHAAAVVKALRKNDAWLADRVYSGVPAGDFGLEQQIGIGPMSGKSNVLFWLERHGFPTDRPALIDAIFERAKQSNSLLSDADIESVVKAELAG
ncbi:MAG: LeuA family protein [Planctomycetota bacterium]